MALGALDRGHVARWLRHFRSWRGDAIIIAEFHIQPDVVGLIGASLVFGAVLEQELAGRWRTILAERS
jgi:hypothetical protein